MKNRFRLYRRTMGGVFYVHDSETGKQESLGTRDRAEATTLLNARNESVRQPQLNLHIAKAYLAGTDSGVSTRTWQNALDAIVETKTGSTQDRWRRAAKETALDLIRNRVIIETQAEQLLACLKAGTVSTNVHLRKLHNFCLSMNWLPWPLIPKRLWPEVRYQPKRAITIEEHLLIIERERNQERRSFYELCWHLGGSQTDIANLKAEDIDFANRTIAYMEGDIRGCFDYLSHEWMLNQIPMDTEVLRRWLKAGYVENRTLFPTEAGTPQGGIISPTLANMTLDGLEQLLKVAFRRRRDGDRQYRLKVNLIRYADDFIITGPTKDVLENEVRPLVEQFLRDRGLQLSPEKTCITPIEEGFDFLGQNLRKYDGKLLIKPSKKNTHVFLEKVRTIIQTNATTTQEVLIRQLNPVIRGWANYHQSIVAADAFRKVDHVLWQSLWRWAKRRHPKKSSQWVMRKYWHRIGERNWVFAMDTGAKTPTGQTVWLKLRLAADTKIQRHRQIKGTANPFDPHWR